MEEKTNNFKTVKGKKGRFNIVDYLIILFVLLAIGSFLIFVDPFSLNLFGESGRDVTLEYTVQIPYVEETLLDKIHNGDIAIDGSSKTELGNVKSVRDDVLYSEIYYDGINEQVKMREYPDRYNLQITIVAEATFVKGDGYRVNGERVAVGKQYDFMFPSFIGQGQCISMRELN